MSYVTVSIVGSPHETRREAIDGLVRGVGGSATWRTSLAAGRTYALLDLPVAFDALGLAPEPGEVVYETAIIAWAVFPTVAEALPALHDALGGAGRPAGVLACLPCERGVIVEWDPARSLIELIANVVDVELRRFRSGRTAELLSALPADVTARIAAAGLQTPGISADRVLDLLIER